MKYSEIIGQSADQVKQTATTNKVRRAEIAVKTAQIVASEKLEEAKEKVQKILTADTLDIEALYKAEMDVAVYEKRADWTDKKLKELF